MADWDKIESSGNVEDRRGNTLIPGIGGLGTILVIGFMLFSGGGDTTQIQNLLDTLQSNQTTQTEFQDTENYLEFSSKVIGSNNEVWIKQFANEKRNYQEPKLVLFRGATQSGCGTATSEIGPHYCQLDQTIYLDETFFDELTSRYGAKGGDVAEAYVMAHEVGHHIQNINGVFEQVDTRDNQNSINVELQADCYAGVWAGSVSEQGIINENEISEAIDAAEAVGDDRIQKSTTGRVNPETWTHGSAAQRKQAFNKGYEMKSLSGCTI